MHSTTKNAFLVFCIICNVSIYSISFAEFNVAVSLPLSGEVAEFGAAVKNGIELARKTKKKSFNSINFFYDDNQYSAAKTISGLRKLEMSNSIDLIFIWGDTPSSAFAPIAEKEKRPVISVCTDPKISKGSNYIVRFINSYDQYAKAVLDELARRSLQDLAVVYVQAPYYESYLSGIKKNLQPNQKVTVVGEYAESDSDFKSSIIKIKSDSFDAVAVLLFPGQIATFYRQAYGLNLKLPSFGGDDFESRSLQIQSGPAIIGALYALNEPTKEFHDLYLQHIGNDSQIAYAANAFEFANLLSLLFGNTNDNWKGEIVLDRIRNISSRIGVLGEYSFKSSAAEGMSFSFPIAVKEVTRTGVKVISYK